MTEQRFDIVVTDKVSKSIRTELAGIGTSARSAYNDLKLLNTELGTRTASAAASAQASAVRTASATARVQSEQAKLAAQYARTATEQAKANAAYLREEQALNRAVAAEQRAIASKERAAAASARNTAAAEREQRALRSLQDTARQELQQQRASNFLAPRGSGKSARDSASVFEQSGQLGPASQASAVRSVATVTALGSANKLSAQYVAQLGFQMNDVFVSLASGQKPMTVFIQQGAQIAQLPAQAGMSWKQFGAAALNTLGIVKRTGDAALDAAAAQAIAAAAAIAAVDATAVASVRAAETEIALARAQQQAAVTATEQAVASGRLTAANQLLASANAEAAISARALAVAQGQAAEANGAANLASTRSLSGLAKGGIIAAVALAVTAVALGGMTREANQGETGLKKYTTQMGYTASEVKKLNAVSVGFGDTAKAVFQVGFQRIAAAFGISTAGIKSAWNSTLNFLASATKVVLASVYAAFAGTAYGIKRIIDNIRSGKSENPLISMGVGAAEAYQDANKFMDDVIKQAQANARGKQAGMASDMRNPGAGKKGGADKSGFDRASELAKDNAQLDRQIGLLGLYGAELERANQLEGIAAKYRENKVPLTEAETAALQKKILTLQEGQRVQEAMTAAEEAANGAGRKYDDTLTALDQLLAANKISQQQYNAQLFLAQRAFEDATEPLAALNRELKLNGELMGLYGRDRDVASYIQQLRQAAEAQGKSIYQPGRDNDPGAGGITVVGRGKMTPEAQAMVDEFREQQKQEQYGQAFEAIDPRQRERPGDGSYMLDHYKELYAEIDRLRQTDVISEEEAARRKQDVGRAHLDARLEATSTVLGQLSTLQTSKNREVAALGKAAAIAQATIDGYRAVQAALAGPPGPPWSFAIAAATGVATVANVAKIAGVGFASGGYTGSMATHQVAGAVHGQEYVMDADTTRRIGVPALDAMRRGSTLAQPGGQGTAGPRVVIRPQPGVWMEEVSTPDGHIEMIARRVTRSEAPRAVASDLRKGSNSDTGRAMKQSFGLQRNDR